MNVTADGTNVLTINNILFDSEIEDANPGMLLEGTDVDDLTIQTIDIVANQITVSANVASGTYDVNTERTILMTYASNMTQNGANLVLLRHLRCKRLQERNFMSEIGSVRPINTLIVVKLRITTALEIMATELLLSKTSKEGKKRPMWSVICAGTTFYCTQRSNMTNLALQTGVCTGHACWPPMGYGPSLAQTVRVTKIAPLHDTVVRLPHCKPCGKNPACHPGAVVASTKTVLAGTDVPGIPLVIPKAGDPETEAILTALAPKAVQLDYQLQGYQIPVVAVLRSLWALLTSF